MSHMRLAYSVDPSAAAIATMLIIKLAIATGRRLAAVADLCC